MFLPSDTFAVGCTGKKQVKENASVSFFTTTRVLVYNALLTVDLPWPYVISHHGMDG